MKNLKKVLALVLAFACAFTMFAGAAFTDSADITQTEAVDMLAALNVIDGYEDGSYRPDDVVTRAEMAKMIYVIRNGGSDVVTQYEGYKTPFADVENVGHWAKGYIAYCYANGIIDGKSATSFDPDAPVTGQEAAKMALVLIGYDAERAGLEGTAWATNTINLATQKDLFNDYTVSITAGAPRQFAAQLLYNTLWAGTVRWSDDANGYEDVTSYVTDNNGVVVGLAYVTVAKRYMGLEEEIVTYKGDSKVNSGLTAAQSMVGVDTIITYVPENGNEWLGESVKVLYKNSKDGNTKGLDKYDTVYGMTLSGETSTVEAVLGDIGDNDGSKIKVDGTKYDVYNNSMDVVVNYDVDNTKSYSAAAFSDKTTGFQKDSADAVKFVLNAQGKVIAAYIDHVEFYKVTGLTSSKITLAGIGALDIDDTMTLDSNVAKDDIVAVTVQFSDKASDDDAYVTITKADIVEDVTVNDMKSSTEVKINDAFAKQAAYNNKITDSNYDTTAVLESTYDFIMYDGYWVAAKKISASSKDIALVTKTAEGINDQVKVMKSDGTEATYNIDDDNGDASDLTDAKLHKLYSFSLVGDNGIQLKNDLISGQTVTGLDFYAGGTADYNKDNKTVTIKNGSTSKYVTADEAVAYIYVTGDDTYAYQIDGLKSFDGATSVEYVLNDDDEVVAFYGVLADKPGATASNDEYGYVVDDVRTTSIDGTKYWEISVWNGTETINIRVEGSSAKADVAKGAFIKYALSGEGTAENGDIEVLSQGNMGIVGTYRADRKLLTLIDKDGNTLNTYAVADDVKIIGVDTADRELVEGIGDPIASIKDEKINEYPANILYVLNSDDEVVAIFVDAENVISQKDYTIPADGKDGPVAQK